MDSDEYILEVLRQLSRHEKPENIRAILLICNMALDHTVASPKLCKKLAVTRRMASQLRLKQMEKAK